MKILQVCSASTLGGGEVHVLQLVEELRSRGHQVRVAGRTGSPVQPAFALPFRNGADLSSILRLRKIIREGAFDIVHAHVARDYPVAAAAMVGLPAPRLVITRQLIHRVKRHPLYCRVDGWIATTDQIARSLSHLTPRELRIIPNWVRSSAFRFRPQPAGRDPKILGLLGQVSPLKGHDDAIRMIRQLGSGFRLVFGGVGKEEYVTGLRARARDLPVEFAGFVDPAGFLERLDILILPSWEEPFGIVLLEAMAAGVNVIATNQGGPPEILDYGNAGILVAPRDPEGMAGAVRTLVSDSELALRLRTEARKRAVEVYDIKVVVPRVEDFYGNLLGS